MAGGGPPLRSVLRRAGRAASETPSGGIAVVGEPEAVAACRAALMTGADAGALPLLAPSRAAAVLYAGSSLQALHSVARSARRPIAACLPPEVAGHAYQVPRVARVVVRPQDAPRAVAAVLDPSDIGVAAALPALRGPVGDRLVAVAAARAAVINLLAGRRRSTAGLLAAVQSELVIRLASVHGKSRRRAPDVLATLVTGQGLRELARGLGAGRLMRLAVAAGGTAAIGRAAVHRFQGR
jgi:hypothetical protein